MPEGTGRINDGCKGSSQTLFEEHPDLYGGEKYQSQRGGFQADINETNILLDEDGNFKGVYDFNLGGREVYINYLFRQSPYVSTYDTYGGIEKDDTFLKRVIHALEIAKKGYSFSDSEKKAAPLLYKCIRPLWWQASLELGEFGNDEDRIRPHRGAWKT